MESQSEIIARLNRDNKLLRKVLEEAERLIGAIYEKTGQLEYDDHLALEEVVNAYVGSKA